MQKSSSRSTRTCVSPQWKTPETAPLYFKEDDMMWFASKLSSAAGALGAEAIELKNWLLHFRCASEDLRVVVVILSD